MFIMLIKEGSSSIRFLLLMKLFILGFNFPLQGWCVCQTSRQLMIVLIKVS